MQPFVLAPAGSPEALYAALDAGADEIYFGLSAHNARGSAKNFSDADAKEAIRACKLRGVRTNITLNTLVTDRELPEALRLAYNALCMGADAFIVQDIGLARALKKTFPSVVLHASTQCACHSVSGAKKLIEAGFERLVLARELDREEIARIVALGVETEIFVHGALCVCHSGLCLMSSVIGGRSGNRGLCAQPCRLPYTVEEQNNASGNAGCGAAGVTNRYPLSLKDLTLASHVPALAALGVTSFKIEGRMKPPTYVSGVTEIWKKLVSENRAARPEELARLDALFSRSGFTDAYFTGACRTENRSMYGVRTELDKRRSYDSGSPAALPARTRGIILHGVFRVGEPPVLTARCADDERLCARVTANFTAQSAASRPLSREDLCASLSKLGGTAFSCAGIHVETQGALFLPKSQLNALRRAAVEALEQKILAGAESPEHTPAFDEAIQKLPECKPVHKNRAAQKSGLRVRLYPASASAVEPMLETAAGFAIESICLPLGLFDGGDLPESVRRLAERGIPFGVRMPRVVFSSEETAALRALRRAAENGARYAVAENIGDLLLIREAGLTVYGGAGLNAFNSQTLAFLAEAGVQSVTLSPELNTAQMRDLVRPAGMSTSRIAAGRLELMVLESCVIRANGVCRAAQTENGGICAVLSDRRRMRFPVRAERRLGSPALPCRNILLNSVPLRLTEKPEECAKSGVEVLCLYDGAE